MKVIPGGNAGKVYKLINEKIQGNQEINTITVFYLLRRDNAQHSVALKFNTFYDIRKLDQNEIFKEISKFANNPYFLSVFEITGTKYGI